MVSSTKGNGIPISADTVRKKMAASPVGLSTLMEAAIVERTSFIHSIIGQHLWQDSVYCGIKCGLWQCLVLASGGTKQYLPVIYGGAKFVSKNVSNM